MMQQANVIEMEEHDHERCAHISLKQIKTTTKVIRDKAISCKSSYTIPKGLLNKRCGEHAKVKINAFLSVFG
jgi:hypothetical protein